MERPSLRRQLVMIFLGIAIPIGILLGLLLFFSGLYSRNRLAAAASGGLDMFTTNFENQLDSVENYLLNLSLNDATFRSLSRTRPTAPAPTWMPMRSHRGSRRYWLPMIP